MGDRDVIEAQKVMLALLGEFDSVCQKYHLTYWLDHGTLLGAVRHNGFIPWDDDLDVTMPREDYERFVEIAADELPENIFLQTKVSDPSTSVHYAKFRDRNSTYIDVWEEGKDIAYHQGIFIDIFPVNFISPDKAGTYSKILNISKVFSNRYLKIDSVAKYFIDKLNSYHSPKNNYIVSGGESMHYVTHVPRDVVFPLSTLKFEEMEVPVPRDSKAYLVSIFGDNYMTLTPKEDQKVHSVYIDTQQKCRYEKRQNG